MERRLQVQGEEQWRKPAADEGLDVEQPDPSNGPDESAWTEVGGPGLRVGVDLVHLDDVEGLYPGAEGIWLTQEEWEEVTRTSGQDSCISDGSGTDTENFNEAMGGIVVEVPMGLKERLAGRFAAKEAVMKALGSGLDRIELTDIEILRRPGGRPRVRLRGSALAAWAYCGLERLELSISHHRDYALAVAVGLTAVRL
ncbi:4'-phosphopantetheinyl transferase superfamily protein [Paenibacillus filicis]|uniref:Holo-[acyl-carrier-protein] synthase n=1 Tax=Paenibacillus filicis TaxID=669464 RepID=A0ABU9DKA6_9BACL